MAVRKTISLRKTTRVDVVYSNATESVTNVLNVSGRRPKSLCVHRFKLKQGTIKI